MNLIVIVMGFAIAGALSALYRANKWWAFAVAGVLITVSAIGYFYLFD